MRARADLKLAGFVIGWLSSFACSSSDAPVMPVVTPAGGGSGIGGQASAEPPTSAGTAGAAAAPYLSGPHGGPEQPCYPNATCNAGLVCDSDFSCHSTSDGVLGAAGNAGESSDGGAAGSASDPPVGSSPSVCDGYTRTPPVLALEDFEQKTPRKGWQTPPLIVDNLGGTDHGGAVGTAFAGIAKGLELAPSGRLGGSGIGLFLDVGRDRSAGALCLDVSRLAGISFWARSSAGAWPLDVEFIIPTTNAVTALGGYGDCIGKCSDHPRVTVALTTKWTHYVVPFSSTTAGNARIEKLLQGICWENEPIEVGGSTFSGFYLDEIAFYAGAAPTGPIAGK